MKCDKHPTYKGLRKTKRNCVKCKELYEHVQKQTRKFGKYHSITTPDFKCNIIHLICELSCVMLSKQRLPRFFWRKNSTAPKYIKEHFNKTWKDLIQWQKKDPHLFKSIETILYHTYLTSYQKKLGKVRVSIVDQPEHNVTIGNDDFDDLVAETFKGRWKSLKELNSGKKKKEGH